MTDTRLEKVDYETERLSPLCCDYMDMIDTTAPTDKFDVRRLDRLVPTINGMTRVTFEDMLRALCIWDPANVGNPREQAPTWPRADITTDGFADRWFPYTVYTTGRVTPPRVLADLYYCANNEPAKVRALDERFAGMVNDTTVSPCDISEDAAPILPVDGMRQIGDATFRISHAFPQASQRRIMEMLCVPFEQSVLAVLVQRNIRLPFNLLVFRKRADITHDDPTFSVCTPPWWSTSQLPGTNVDTLGFEMRNRRRSDEDASELAAYQHPGCDLAWAILDNGREQQQHPAPQPAPATDDEDADLDTYGAYFGMPRDVACPPGWVRMPWVMHEHCGIRHKFDDSTLAAIRQPNVRFWVDSMMGRAHRGVLGYAIATVSPPIPPNVAAPALQPAPTPAPAPVWLPVSPESPPLSLPRRPPPLFSGGFADDWCPTTRSFLSLQQRRPSQTTPESKSKPDPDPDPTAHSTTMRGCATALLSAQVERMGWNSPASLLVCDPFLAKEFWENYVQDPRTRRVWAMGRDKRGRLGVGVRCRVWEPSEILDVRDMHIAQTACDGTRVSIVVTTNGEVHGTGDNTYGQLGGGGTHIDQRRFIRINELTGHHVVSVACRHTNVLALLTDGTLREWGRADDDSITEVLETLSVPRPVRGLEGQRVVAIACGSEHSVAVTAAGRVYTWGLNQHYQLGYRLDVEHDTNTSNAPIPMLVESLATEHITMVSCGSHHTAVVSAAGNVFTWGHNHDGALGLGKDLRGLRNGPPHIVELPDNERAASLACGNEHVCVLLRTGKICTWGSNTFGQLGDPTRGWDDPTPRIMPFDRAYAPGPVRSVHAGGNASGAIVGSGVLYLWGASYHNALGAGRHTTKVNTPTRTQFGDHVQSVTIGDGFTFVLLR